MATEVITLPTTQDYANESPYARCPIHGRKIFTHSGRVNKIVCDFCGKTIKYGGCGDCISTYPHHDWCDVCGKNFCSSHGGGVHYGGTVVNFYCQDHRP